MNIRQVPLFSSKPSTRACSPKTEYTASISIVSLRIIKEKTVPYLEKKLSSPEKVVSLLNRVLNLEKLDREALIVIPLNAKCRPQALHIAHLGSLTETVCHPREIFKLAILTNAHSIILAHNHPSGSPEPSNHDIKFTEHIKKAGKLLGIPLLDHIIVATEGYFSFKENNLI